jgi:hypothetical protein
VSFPGEDESPTFPLVRLAGAGLCLLFSNFRFGMAETGSIPQDATGPLEAIELGPARVENVS